MNLAREELEAQGLRLTSLTLVVLNRMRLLAEWTGTGWMGGSSVKENRPKVRRHRAFSG
jgi:hypothetical protein